MGHAIKTAIVTLARRVEAINTEIAALDAHIDALVARRIGGRHRTPERRSADRRFGMFVCSDEGEGRSGTPSRPDSDGGHFVR